MEARVGWPALITSTTTGFNLSNLTSFPAAAASRKVRVVNRCLNLSTDRTEIINIWLLIRCYLKAVDILCDNHEITLQFATKQFSGILNLVLLL